VKRGLGLARSVQWLGQCWATAVQLPARLTDFPLLTRTDWLRVSSSVRSNRQSWPFPWGQSGRAVMLATHCHLVPRSTTNGSCSSTSTQNFTARCLTSSRKHAWNGLRHYELIY
jgi:hypothetical protein